MYLISVEVFVETLAVDSPPFECKVGLGAALPLYVYILDYGSLTSPFSDGFKISASVLYMQSRLGKHFRPIIHPCMGRYIRVAHHAHPEALNAVIQVMGIMRRVIQLMAITGGRQKISVGICVSSRVESFA